MATCKGRILLVDDDVQLTRLLKVGLETHGYAVCAENETKMALPIARAFKPDLIVLDLSMPGKDGDELAEEIKADDEAGAIPILFLSGLLNEKEAAYFREQGETVLLKPTTIDELSRRIEERLGTK